MMSQHTVTLTWWHIAMITLSVLSIGIAIGAFFSRTLFSYTLSFVSFGVVLGGYSLIKLLKRGPKKELDFKCEICYTIPKNEERRSFK